MYLGIRARARREGAEILWADEVGVDADHHPGCGYARKGERATRDVPGPHIRVNRIAAIGNGGKVRFMTYKGSHDAAVFLLFLGKLIERARRKVFLIADRLEAHETPVVLAWVKAHAERIEVFSLPTYSPEMNPVEYLNNDMKGGRQRGRPAGRQGSLAHACRGVHEHLPCLGKETSRR